MTTVAAQAAAVLDDLKTNGWCPEWSVEVVAGAPRCLWRSMIDICGQHGGWLPLQREVMLFTGCTTVSEFEMAAERTQADIEEVLEEIHRSFTQQPSPWEFDERRYEICKNVLQANEELVWYEHDDRFPEHHKVKKTLRRYKDSFTFLVEDYEATQVLTVGTAYYT